MINQPTDVSRRILVVVWRGEHELINFSSIGLAHQILLFLIVLYDDFALPETLVVEWPQARLLVLKLRKIVQRCRSLLTSRRSRLKDLCEILITEQLVLHILNNFLGQLDTGFSRNVCSLIIYVA